MSDDFAKRAGQEAGVALVTVVAEPLISVLRVVGMAVGKTDLQDTAVAVLQEDIVRMFDTIQTLAARMDEELRSKIDAAELAEVLLQSATNMGRTASREKRRLMRNIAVNGVADHGEQRLVERRLFVQAMLDLDVSHIEFLRDASDADGVIDPPASELTPAIVQPLVARGFLDVLQSSTGYAFDSPSRIPVETTYETSPLGERFLAFLKDPDVD